MNNLSITKFISMVVLLVCCSCNLPGGLSYGPVNEDGQETINLEFSNVNLKFDFSTKLNTAFIINDYEEFITAHNVSNQDRSNYSGAITNLGSILWDVDNYDEAHKPCISVTLEDMFMGKTEHKCNKEDITWNTVLGIPKISNFYQGTVEIKSIKTRDNGVQVVWKKSALKDNWPINEFVADGTISCDVAFIIKVGTNNASGNVAVRDNTIIQNTLNSSINEDVKFILDDKQLISPDLRKPVIVNGAVSQCIKWSEPVIYKAI